MIKYTEHFHSFRHKQNTMEHSKMAGLIILFFSSTVLASDRRSEGILHPMPDDINVKAHTTAWINWTHSLGDSVTIVWNFLDGAKSVKLMDYVDNELDIWNKRQGIRGRIGHTQDPGSASLYLRNVTSADAGKYEVRIAQTGEVGAIDSSVVTLRVVNGSDIKFSVTIDGVAYDLSVENNGTAICLPASRVIFNPTPSIMVKISKVTPPPISIEHIFKNIDDGYQKPYEDGLQHFVGQSAAPLDWSTEVTVEIKFNIQNLDMIRVSKRMYSQGSWIKRLGNIAVLAHTTAHFNWTHTIRGTLHIAWYYKGTESARELSTILEFSENQVYSPINAHQFNRLAYEPFPGSAVMQLSNVKKMDEGIYEVKVADLNSDTIYSITDRTKLDVVRASDLKFNIDIDRESYCLSVADNGTDVHLPDVRTKIPAHHKIGLKIPDSAPEPTAINIVHLIGGIAYVEAPCEYARVCEKHLHFGLELQSYPTTTIKVTVGFGIQNLGIVSYQYRVVHSRYLDAVQEVMDSGTIEKSPDPFSGTDSNSVSCDIMVICCIVTTFLRR